MRGSQVGRDVRVYSFKLDRRADFVGEEEAQARLILDDWLDRGGNLRAQIIHWLMVSESEMVLQGDQVVVQEIRDIMTHFKAEFFVQFMAFMRENNVQMLRDFVSDEAVENKVALDSDFIDSMMNLFDGGNEK
jgi:hypothetical protein